jgi:hypothetical protein
MSDSTEKYIKDLFHQFEVRLYTNINTYHIELRQELLKIVNERIELLVEEAVDDIRNNQNRSKFFEQQDASSDLYPLPELGISQFTEQKSFPVPSTPWDGVSIGKTFPSFPPARIISPIEEEEGKEEEEEIATQGEGEKSDLLSAIEQLIEEKLSILSTLTAPPVPEVETVEPAPAIPVEPEAPVYVWNNYDPYAYARKASDVPGFN